MGKDLYYTIPKFFEDRMAEHSAVASCLRMESQQDEFLYEIERTRHHDRIRVWLADQYRFTDMDYLNRPRELRPGDYILIAKPEGGGGASPGLIKQYRIGVGKLRDLMGALNKREMWKYIPPDDKKPSRRRRGQTARELLHL